MPNGRPSLMRQVFKLTAVLLLIVGVVGCAYVLTNKTGHDSESARNGESSENKLVSITMDDSSDNKIESAKKREPVKASQEMVRSDVGKLELYPTIECLGVTYSEVPERVKGSKLAVDWKVVGSDTWSNGPYLLKNPINDKLRASVFPLPAGKNIEVRVVNRNEILKSGSVQLKADVKNFGKVLKTIHVSVKGCNKNDGSKEAPYRTIRKALIKARAGTEIVVHGGVYNEVLAPLRSGKDGAYITLRGAEGEKAVITGGVVLDKKEQWKYENGVFYADVKDATNAVVKNKRIYSYPSHKSFLDQYDPKHKPYFMRMAESKIKEIYKEIPYSMGYDSKKKRMGFRVPKGVKPWDSAISIAQTEHGIKFEKNSYYRISNIRFTMFNRAGIHIRQKSNNIVIDNCEFSEIGNSGILLDGLSYENLIENNRFYENESGNWVWALRKATVHESCGVAGWRCGAGNVVRGNYTDGTFNGVAMTTKMASQSEIELSNTDIYNNVCVNHDDDAIEPEGSGVNNRVFNNHVKNSFVGISLAPINVGPTYVVRNIFETRDVCFKLQNHNTAGAVKIYNNTCVSERGDGIVNHNRRGGYVDNMDFKNNIINVGRYLISGFKGNLYDDNIFHTTDKGRFVKTGGEERLRVLNLKELSDAVGRKVDFTIAKIEFERGKDGVLMPKGDAGNIYNKGVDLRGFTEKHLGSGPDIGYYEYK